MSQKHIIWMHGLGAGSDDMKGLFMALRCTNTYMHRALQAPNRPVTINQGYVMPAWYDIFSLERGGREDRAGILASEGLIKTAINQLQKKGVDAKNILLAGFSQGAAMALFTALKFAEPLGGVIALSGYLPLADDFTLENMASKVATPVFLAHGKFDEVVPLNFGLLTKHKLNTLKFENIKTSLYDMGHEVCEEEVLDISHWLDNLHA